MSTIGIIGAGNIGRAIAQALARNGIAVTLSNSRGPDSLRTTVAEIGPLVIAGTREEAAAKDIVFVAVNWSKLPDALAGLPPFAGRIVVDANNPIEAPLFAGRAPWSRLVRSFRRSGARRAGGEGVQSSLGAASRNRPGERRRQARAVLLRRRR